MFIKNVSNCKPCHLFSRGDPQKHQQRPRSKTTESLRLKTISLEPKSWRWKWRTKRERRRMKVSIQVFQTALCVINIRLMFFILCNRWLGECQY